MRNLLISIGAMIAFALPSVAAAQESVGQFENLTNLVTSLGTIIDMLLPIVVGVALLFFFWGLAVFILNAGSEEKRAEGKNIMIWGVIALFVMVSVWGIVRFIGDAFGIQQGGTIDVPEAPAGGID